MALYYHLVGLVLLISLYGFDSLSWNWWSFIFKYFIDATHQGPWFFCAHYMFSNDQV
jgi:hypothetical protein